jgi:hypothetical protein
LQAFQLPVYERFTRRPQELPAMLEHVGRFVAAIIAFKPQKETEWLRTIAAEICRVFAF